jgi:hypothetical protein
VTELKKYPKIGRIGHDENNGILEEGHLVVKEKMDGANIRFTYYPEEDRIVFGSRNVEYWNDGNQVITDSEKRWFTINSYLNKLPRVNRKTERQDDVDKSFNHAIEFVRETVDLERLTTQDIYWGPLTFFGEAMHSHTLDYDWDETPPFLGFDIYNHNSEKFLQYELAEDLLERLGLPTVPVVYEGPAMKFTNLEAPDSEYHDGPAEGVVIVNETTGQRAKYRSDKFKEMHSSQSVSDPDEYEPSDGEVLARKFTTEARVLKMIHKYENRGRTIEMSIMEDLWEDVFDDIIEEEFETIFLGNYDINTKNFRSEVAGITADVLQSYLERPDDSVLNRVQG